MQAQSPFYKMYLREELARRCENNANYSMRSFAKALNIDPAVLSRTLSDKRALSYKVAHRVIDQLSLSPHERTIFLESVADDHKMRGLRRSTPDIGAVSAVEYSRDVDADLFRVVADWYHLAIRQLTQVKGFRSEPRWISKRLGITVLETKLAIQRLLSTGLLVEVDGELQMQDQSLNTKDKGITTPALKRHCRQMLQKAIYSLENDPIEQRNVTGMTMPINPTKIPVAKKMIQEFMSELSKLLESGDTETVYQLSVCLFPLEKQDCS